MALRVGKRKRPYGMLEPGVVGARIDKIGYGHLPYPAKPLEWCAVDYFFFQLVEFYGAVDFVFYDHPITLGRIPLSSSLLCRRFLP